MKFSLIVFLLWLVLPGVSAQNKKELSFTIISSEQGKLPKEDAVYSYEISTTFSLKKPPTYFHKTEHVTWTKEESPLSNFLKEKPGQKLYFDVVAVSGSYNATDVQNKGKKLSYSTNRTLTSSESDQFFASSELKRTASGAVLLIPIPDITTWAPFNGSDNQPTECAHVGSYGGAKYAYQFSFTEAELRKWNDVKKNWQASCKLDPDYNIGDFSSSIKTMVTLNYLAEEKPTLLFAGCENLVVGETGSLAATATPSSGTYRYWAEGNEVSISGSDAQAKITANVPGKTKVWVEYTTPKGEQIKESKTIYAIKVNSINDGNPLQIGLYDVKGKPTKGIKNFPVSVEPASSLNQLKFKPANEAFISAAPEGNRLNVQAVKKGKTYIKAYTDCGSQTGPSVEVEVLNCDDEVVEELRRQEKMLKSRLESNIKQIMETLSDDEFSRAADNIKQSTKTFFRKMGELIIAAAGMSKATQGVEAAGKVVDIYNLSEAIVDGDMGNTAIATGIIIAGTKNATLGSGIGALNTAREAAQASQQFGRDLGSLYGASERLSELEAQYANTLKEYEAIREILFGVCKRDAEPGAKEPEVKETPKPKESAPKQKKDTKVTASGKPEEKTTREPVQPKEKEKPGTESEKPEDDISTPDENKSFRPSILIPDSANCGCAKDNSKSNSVGINGFQINVKNMQQCVETLEKNSLKPFEENLKLLEKFENSLKEFLEMPESSREQQLKKISELAKEPAKNKKQSIQLFNQIQQFNQTNEGCEKAMSSDLIQNLKIHWDRLL